MLVRFFFDLRAASVPVTLPEFLTLLDALGERVAWLSAEDFYYLGRTCLVKDERFYDRFDRVFAEHFEGAERLFAELLATVPEEWLKTMGERVLSEDDRARIEALGGWDKLLETLRKRLEEQRGRHEGGSKWIGTGGTSPFGHGGYHPEGVRIGGSSRHRRAVKVWEQREFANLDDQRELGTRNFKVALRRLRRFARQGAPDQLDLDGTVDATARNAGLLDIKLVPERRNAVRVLLFLDIGGSMDDHVRVSEELFSAARSEFRHFEHFYFHNFVYETLWKDNRRRHAERLATDQLIRTYGPEYRVIFVGDATMSPYEITQAGGSVEHWNKEAGAVWMQRLTAHFPHVAWLNPEPEARWDYTPSVRITRELLGGRMFPLTLSGIDRATAELRRKGLPSVPADADFIPRAPPSSPSPIAP
jgi:hypothetical protein